jgi:hypothetical protein
MNAKIVYEMCYGPNPFVKDNPCDAWILWQAVIPEVGIDIHHEPVAIFNRDSDARTFMAHIWAEGLDGKLVKLPRDMADDLASLQEMRKGNER